MEYLTTITNLISSIGFPIVVCLLCFWYINKTSEQNKTEIDKLTDAVENNTKIMEKILIKLEDKKDI